MITNSFSITDLRQKTLDVINAAKASGYVQIIQNSKVDVAVVDAAYLTALQEAYEDQMDIIEFDRVKNDPPVMSLDEYLAKHPLR
ncbi:MAG: hypothetical protein A3A32_02585 [Candidatus Wildermuthbacteria bacterium RIFCSPLOWO2_01_FULL_48_35]|uniref:Antitoxin n=1 Tax=Candidatus Wildermuthbacteria bacterium RIFCSPLOWO2_01_FULL_48_35 TaxID=1802463 RepID=A0A1G2RSV1_9BACT|nr:MAG: hypothetical protein A3A32_02585 [Candidatus Wildermuthbacteria bacterium RIFCSPLOWO2_01_FULL_48_35]